MTQDANTLEHWLDREVCDNSGETIGRVENVFSDTDTRTPVWVAIDTGMSGGVTLAPVTACRETGEQLHVDFDAHTLQQAPTLDRGAKITAEYESVLSRHYGIHVEPPPPAAPAENAAQGVTRYEEQLRVGTTTEEIGRVRLRKRVETERVEKTVTVSREEARIVVEPITDENMDEALRDAEFAEAAQEVVLHAEVPVVEKKAVPKERVRLEKEIVTGEAQVSEDLRKERIDVENLAPRDHG